MDRQTLSIMKACEAVGVSRRTIYNWIAAGKVEYVRTAGGSIRIFADTLWRDATPVNRALRRRVPPVRWDTRESRFAVGGRPGERAEGPGRNEPPVPQAEQPARDRPGSRGDAGGEGRGRGASSARVREWSRACSMRWAPRARSDGYPTLARQSSPVRS